MLTSNKLKTIALKNLVKACLFIFLIISLSLIYNNSNKYEKTLKQLEKKEIEYLKKFSKDEEESKLRVGRWSSNKIDDFKEINKIKDYLVHFGGLLRRAPSYGAEEAKDIIATPGSEYRIKKENSKTENNWPITGTRGLPLRVNYDFGTFIPGDEILQKTESYNKEYIREDKLRFASFINEITEMVKNYNNNNEIKPIFQSRTEYSTLMYGVFGLSDDIDQFFPELEILWIYVGSSEGAFATFPGNDQEYWNENDNRPYNPKDRPWFKEAMYGKGDDLYANHDDIGLSSVYDDFSEHLDSVRTLWHKVEVNDDSSKRTYVIGIDFYLSNNAFSAGITDLINKKDIPSIKNIVIFDSMMHGLIVSFLIFILGLFFIFIGPLSFARFFVFGLSSYKSLSVNKEILAEYMGLVAYDDLNNNSFKLEETNKKIDDNSFSRKLSVGAQSNKLFNILASLESKKSHSQQKISMVQAIHNQEINSLYTGIRGKEFWKITKSEGILGSCPTCGEVIKVAPEEQNWEQVMVINHVAQDIPEVLTLLTNGVEPQEWIKNSLTEHILKSNQYIDQSSNLQKTLYETARFKIPYQLKNYPPLAKMQNDFHILQSGRYNSGDMINLSKHLYKNSYVKAVCRVGYFKLLLEMEKNGEGFLFVGESIERILIAFTTEEFEITKRWFESEGKNKIRKDDQISLYLVNILDLPEGLREYRRWDFAIVDSSISTNSNANMLKNMGSTVVITSDYNDGSNSEEISGAVSWRLADVTFYETLYRAITRNRREENNLYIPK